VTVKLIRLLFLLTVLLKTGIAFAVTGYNPSFTNQREAIHYIDSLNEEAYKLAPSKIHPAEKISYRALILSEKYFYPIGKINALNNISVVERNQGNFVASLKHLKKSLLIAYRINNKSCIGKCYYHMGDLHKSMGNYERSIFYFRQAFYLFKQCKDYSFASMALNNLAHAQLGIGIASGDTNYFTKTRKLYLAAVKISEEHNLPQRVTIGYINLSNLYNVYGQRIKSEAYINKSLDYSLKSFALAKKNGYTSQMAISLINIGEIKESKKEPDSSLFYYKKALELYEQTDEPNWLVYLHTQISRLYIAKGETQKAINHLDAGIAISKNQNFKPNLQNCYELLADIYQSSGQFEKSLAYYKLASDYKDSIAVEKNNISRAGLQIEFEADQKDKEIALLNKNKEIQSQALKLQTIYRNMLIVGCCLLSLLLIWVDYRYREKQRTTQKILKAKEEAERAKEVQEQFLTNTSHEIRTPMNGVLGMTNYLLNSDLSEKQREYVNAIHESANNLLVIINDLLDMSKIKAGKMSFVQKPFTIKSLFKNLSLVLDDKMREKNLAFELIIDDNVPVSVIGDRVRVQQVLLNLAGNAVKFTERGNIFILVKLNKLANDLATIQFIVKDTGVGIPSENLASIFESFTQVDAKRNRKHGGTGLGLSISKQLVEQMGGSIHVESALNKGSEFSFLLPLAINPIPEIESLPSNKIKQETKNLSGIHVLVVDDNKINRQVAKLTLEKWLIHVSLAESGNQAIELLTKNPKIDLVLMDITMPEMDGFETTLHIRNKFEFPLNNVPIVAMTASAFAGEKDKCLAMGLNDYISKPFKPVELFELVKKNLPGKFNKEETNLIDLRNLFEKADGNVEFLADIMETYVNEMPGYLNELNEAFTKNDLKATREQAHKMKSPTALFGALELKNHLHFIELNIEKSGCTAHIQERLKLVNSLGNLSVCEVKKELEKVWQPAS
jgi:signal transduction histidine kinase/DNA-binding NarL/FixJ family response regulator